jgi:signal transduction histidine kinase
MGTIIAAGPVAVIGARVEPARQPVGGDGIHPPADAAAARAPYRCDVHLTRPPWTLRSIGVVALVVIFVSIATTDPKPALEGRGALVALAALVLAGGVWMSFPRRALPASRRLAGLVLVAAATAALTGLQPESAGYAAIFYVAAIGTVRLPDGPAARIFFGGLALEVAVGALFAHRSASDLAGLVFSVVPWFFIARLLRDLRTGRDEAEALVEELQESRAAHAASAAEAERSRVAREMHDVLAHSLSALALQLEGARLLAQDRDGDPEVVAAIERAHHLAAGGLHEAREAIAALRGDALPGPERLPALAEDFDGACTLTVTGEPRPLGSEARLAIYRTAQEALTNVRRHSAADRVEIRLDHEPGGTRLTVQDFGPGAPVAIGGGPGGGYGLTGMRERAELLGGRLEAGPTRDGFRVELWLP